MISGPLTDAFIISTYFTEVKQLCPIPTSAKGITKFCPVKYIHNQLKMDKFHIVFFNT